jgi:predicted ATP-grasp superfamily ATP-dependent carboligase
MIPSSHAARVGIFDADAPTALAFARSLGRAGVAFRIYSSRRWPVARFSKYCGEFGRCPDPEDADRFQPWLANELRLGAIDFVAPTSDLIAFHLAEVHDVFAPELRARLPAPGEVLACLFKDRFEAVCGQLGFRTPWAAYPRSVEDARDNASTFRYPAILKPKSHIGVGLSRGEVVRDSEELRRSYRAYPIPPRQAGVCARYPALSLPMIQEYVPTALDNLYSVSGILGGGEVIALAGSQKVAQWPPTLGIGIEFRCAGEPELLSRGAALARAVLGRGIFEVELIRDARIGDWVAIDLNPRAHGFISFDIARNNDLPLLWYRLVSGQRVDPVAPPRDDLAWTHSVPHAVWRWVNRVKGVAAEQTRPGARVDVVNDPSDRLPTAPFLAVMLRHPGGLVRPFLASSGDDARRERDAKSENRALPAG